MANEAQQAASVTSLERAVKALTREMNSRQSPTYDEATEMVTFPAQAKVTYDENTEMVTFTQ